MGTDWKERPLSDCVGQNSSSAPLGIPASETIERIRRQFIFPVVSPWKDTKEWDIMYRDNKKMSEALRNGKMTQSSETGAEHTPRENSPRDANPGKNLASETPVPNRAG